MRRSFYFRNAFFRWLMYVVVMAVTHFTFLSCLKSKTPQRMSFEESQFHTQNTTNIVWYSILSVFLLLSLWMCVSSMRKNELVLLFYRFCCLKYSNVLLRFHLPLRPVLLHECDSMPNYPLRILSHQDLNLSSLSNSAPLICTRAPRRYSIRDPHQHTSK